MLNKLKTALWLIVPVLLFCVILMFGMIHKHHTKHDNLPLPQQIDKVFPKEQKSIIPDEQIEVIPDEKQEYVPLPSHRKSQPHKKQLKRNKKETKECTLINILGFYYTGNCNIRFK